MKLGKFLLSISLAVVLSGCAMLGGGFTKKSSSSNSYAGGSGNGWPWGGDSKSSSPTSSGGPSSSSDPNAPTVYSVQIEAPKTIIAIDEMVQFYATIQTSNGTYSSPYEANWTSSDNSVASVEYGGRVTGKSIGTAVIKAIAPSNSSVFDTITITVTQNEMVVVGAESFDLDTTYKLGLRYDDGYGYYYANGEITNQNGSSLLTVSSFSSAADLVIEGTTGHYHLALSTNGQKKYINSMSDIDYHISLDDSPVNDWSWDNNYYTFTTIVNGAKYLIQYKNRDYYQDAPSLLMVNYSEASYPYVARLMILTEKMDPESIEIIEDDFRALVGSSFTLHAKISPIGASLTRLSWTVLDNEYVQIDSNGYGRVFENAKRGTTATIKAYWGSSVSDTVTISIYNYGTLNDPLSVDETLDLIDKEPGSNSLYISGIVTSNTAVVSNNYWQTIVLANNSGSISSALYAYNVYQNYGYGSIYTEANSLVGKRIILRGYGYYSDSESKYYLNSVSLYSVTNN